MTKKKSDSLPSEVQYKGTKYVLLNVATPKCVGLFYVPALSVTVSDVAIIQGQAYPELHLTDHHIPHRPVRLYYISPTPMQVEMNQIKLPTSKVTKYFINFGTDLPRGENFRYALACSQDADIPGIRDGQWRKYIITVLQRNVERGNRRIAVEVQAQQERIEVLGKLVTDSDASFKQAGTDYMKDTVKKNAVKKARK